MHHSPPFWCKACFGLTGAEESWRKRLRNSRNGILKKTLRIRWNNCSNYNKKCHISKSSSTGNVTVGASCEKPPQKCLLYGCVICYFGCDERAWNLMASGLQHCCPSLLLSLLTPKNRDLEKSSLHFPFHPSLWVFGCNRDWCFKTINILSTYGCFSLHSQVAMEFWTLKMN